MSKKKIENFARSIFGTGSRPTVDLVDSEDFDIPLDGSEHLEPYGETDDDDGGGDGGDGGRESDADILHRRSNVAIKSASRREEADFGTGSYGILQSPDASTGERRRKRSSIGSREMRERSYGQGGARNAGDGDGDEDEDQDQDQDQDQDEDDNDNAKSPVTAWEVYTSLKHVGIPLNYLSIGVVYGTQAAILYPLFNLRLNSPQNYQNALSNMITLFWAFKLFYGFASDAFPIFGYRRKSYIVGGWFLSALLTAGQAAYVKSKETHLFCYDGSGFPVPSIWTSASANNGSVVARSGTEHANGTLSCPPDTSYEAFSVDSASFDGNLYVLMMMTTNFAYMFADVAADALTLELAKREPARCRGQLQSYNYCTRFVSTMVVFLVQMFALNSPLYGGEYDFGISLSTFLGAMAIVQAIPIPFYFLLEEEKARTGESASLRRKFSELGNLVTNKAFGALILFCTFWHCFTGIQPVGSNGLAKFWVGASNQQAAMAGLFVYAVTVVVVWINAEFFVHVSWRIIYVIGCVASVLMGSLTLIVVFNVERSPYFWIFTKVDVQIAQLMGWLATVWACNEMAPRGLEGTALALTTTASNAGAILGTFAQNALGRMVAPDVVGGIAQEVWDAPETARQYATNVYVVSALNLVALAFLWLLPGQKEEARRRYAEWGSSRSVMIAVLFAVVFAMTASVLVSFLTIYCGCHPLFGGRACEEGTCTAPLFASNVTVR